MFFLFPKLFWATVRKICSDDWEKLSRFEAESREFAIFLRSLEQFIPTLKVQYNFSNRMVFQFVPGCFSDLLHYNSNLKNNWNLGTWRKNGLIIIYMKTKFTFSVPAIPLFSILFATESDSPRSEASLTRPIWASMIIFGTSSLILANSENIKWHKYSFFFPCTQWKQNSKTDLFYSWSRNERCQSQRNTFYFDQSSSKLRVKELH